MENAAVVCPPTRNPAPPGAGDRLTTTAIDPMVAEAAAGDPDAVNALAAMIAPMMVRYCRARLGRRDFGPVCAEDVAQEICVAVLQALPTYRDRGGSFLFLLRAIASNKVADAFRVVAREHTRPTAEVPERNDTDTEPERRALEAERGRRLGALLERLPTVQREILVLRVVVGLSAGETARAVGLSPANVRTLQHRALRRLRGWVGVGEL